MRPRTAAEKKTMSEFRVGDRVESRVPAEGWWAGTVVAVGQKTTVRFDEGEWSVAEMNWDGRRRVGIRWNGDLDDPSDLGNPRSRNYGTWFVLPDELGGSAEAFATAMCLQAAAECEARLGPRRPGAAGLEQVNGPVGRSGRNPGRSDRSRNKREKPR
jgi:hypothetical protein